MLWLHAVATLLFVGLLPLTLMLVLRWNASRSARRHATVELQRLRESVTSTVTGTLRVEGTPVGDAAAVTRWRSASRFSLRRPASDDGERAEKLYVVAGARRYELRGPIEVSSGSEMTFPGERAASIQRKEFLVRASLAEGDEVIVVGVASGSVPGEEYRDQGDTVLAPLPDAAVIFACATARPRPRVPPRALLRHFGVLPLALLGCLPLYAFASDYARTDCEAECKPSGRCTITSRFETYTFGVALAGVWRGHHVGCAASSDVACAAADACRTYGQCTARAGACVATRGEDCRATESCLTSGWCSPSEGRCSAVTAEDCHYTESCVLYGRCLPREGVCGSVSDASCAGTAGCRGEGRCAAKGDVCQAATAADCASTDGCREYGRCSPVGGSCAVASDADCRGSDGCRERGLCSADAGRCVAKTTEDCRGSTRCADSKACAPSGGECVADAPTCRGSLACKHWGKCDGDASCRARTQADCAQAEICRDKPGCRPLGGSCATSCRQRETCTTYGFCTDAAPDRCIVGADADCAASELCREVGFCSLQGGSCSIRDDADCARTFGCKAQGRCTYDRGSCVRGRADCEASEECRRLGRCSAGPFSCGAPSSEDCAKGEVCAKFGWCTSVRTKYSMESQCGPSVRN